MMSDRRAAARVSASFASHVCLLLLLAAPVVRAQAPSALSGVVTDESGASAANVELTLVSESIGVQRQARSASDGTFLFTSVPPGTYALTAVHAGFAPIRIDGIVLAPSERREQAVQLRVASLSERVTVMTSTVVTHSASATKTDAPLLEIPQSITVISGDELRAWNTKTVTEAVRYAPGVMTEPFGRDPRFDQLYLRGFSASGQGDYRDGLKQPSVNFTFFRTEPYGLERLEVVKGPASVLYGQNNPGGLVDRVTKRPSAQTLREVELQAGRYDRVQGAFDFAGPMPATHAGSIA